MSDAAGPFRARRILFDLDGTLVDSTAAVARSWTAIAGDLGRDPDEIVGRYHGMPASVALPLIDPTLDDERIRRLSDRLLELEVADTDGVVALPGARELLAALPEGSWAIVTSCSARLAAVRLGVAGLPTPAVVVTADDVARGKPDPEPYRLGAERCGVAPADCLVVEDAPAGITAAREAGCQVLGVPTTHATLEAPMVRSLADVVVTATDWADDGRLGVGAATLGR